MQPLTILSQVCICTLHFLGWRAARTSDSLQKMPPISREKESMKPLWKFPLCVSSLSPAQRWGIPQLLPAQQGLLPQHTPSARGARWCPHPARKSSFISVSALISDFPAHSLINCAERCLCCAGLNLHPRDVPAEPRLTLRSPYSK